MMSIIFICMSIKYIIPLIQQDTSDHRIQYITSLPWYLIVVMIILIITIVIKFPDWETALFLSSLMSWMFLFFDSRYYALGALWMLWMTIGHLLFDNPQGAEQSSIVLYYFLICATVFGLCDEKIDTLISYLQDHQ